MTADGSTKLLLVDDSPDSLVAIGAVFDACEAQVLTAASGQEALRLLLHHEVAAIVLDVNMPGMDGFETASLIRLNKRHEHTPILFLTGFRDDSHLARGYSLQAVDFLFKPIAPEVLRSKISVFLSLARNAAMLRSQSEQIRVLNVELERKVEERTAELRIATSVATAARAAADTANEFKSYFLAQLTHELRTPLNAVIGYAELLEEEAAARELHDFLPDIHKIRRAAAHLTSLISNVLDLSKIEAGKMEVCPERFDIARLLDEVAATAQPLVAANGNTLHVRHCDDLGEIESDPTRIRQCLLNLLSNAARFTSQGIIVLESHKQDGRALFRVEDTGSGMTEEQLSRLFRPFSQVHAGGRKGGTGLGLTITRQLCRLLGGDIEVESQVGRGTALTISLPLSQNAEHELAANQSASL